MDEGESRKRLGRAAGRRASRAGPSLNLAGSLTYDGLMIRVDIADAKTHLSRYLDSVEKGERVVICRRNVPIAEIHPVSKPLTEPRPVGIDRGMTIPAAFFEPLPDDLLDAFEGGRGPT